MKGNICSQHCHAGRPLAFLGGTPAFRKPLHVGRPNIGAREKLIMRINDALDRRWLSNNGPLLKEFEQLIAGYVGAKYCVAICNATIALQIAISALKLHGEVIVPSFTFVATAHALQWQGIKPIFCDIDPITHNIDPILIERLISERTTGIIGVHLWGRPCDDEAISKIAEMYGLKVIYDAAHAFGCSHKGNMIGNLGDCEVFSFHATKFVNSFEGGAITTNNETLYEKLNAIRDFGYSRNDHILCLGTNGKMTEVSAAMGITSLESIDELIEINHRNYKCYQDGLEQLKEISLIEYNRREKCNYQYIVTEINPDSSPLNRDELIEVLHAENILARKYFWPGCHRVEPYCSNSTNAAFMLPVTEDLAKRLLVLPTGQVIEPTHIESICEIISCAFHNASSVKNKYAELFSPL